MAKKIVHTQYRENYGAHQWDGKGECPQYWKNKGGDTYVVFGSVDATSSGVIHNTIEYSSEYSSEHILSIEDYSEWHENTIWEPWQERTYLAICEDGTIVRERHSGTEDLRRGLKRYKHAWIFPNAEAMRSGDSTHYSVEYIFEDGHVANSEEDARAHFEVISA